MLVSCIIFQMQTKRHPHGVLDESQAGPGMGLGHPTAANLLKEAHRQLGLLACATKNTFSSLKLLK